jgi:hypothetical protein
MLGRVVEKMHQHLRDAIQIHSHRGESFRDFNFKAMTAKRLLRTLNSSVDRLTNLMRLKNKLELMGIELRYLCRFADQAVKPVALFIDDLQ